MSPVRNKLLVASVIACLLALASAGPSSAKKVTKVASTKVTLSVTKAADGTITARATYTSSSPRCLGAKRWKKEGDEYEGAPEFALFYGGADYARPPGGTQLKPVSAFGRSPLVWQAAWSGTAPVVVEKGRSSEVYKSTVGAALGIDGGASTPVFEDTYKSGKDKIALKCSPTTPLNERLRNQPFP